MYSYKVKAIGYGTDLLEYPLEFTVTSNYDIEVNKESVVSKVLGGLRKEWGTAYRLVSVQKENYTLTF